MLIDECHQWSNNNRMQLNASKTKVINISLKKKLTMTTNYLIDNSHVIDIVNHSKLLGVHIDAHLSFNHHITHIKHSANSRCHGLLLLKKAGVNSDSLVMLYKAQVLPVITHAAAAWYPYTTVQQQINLESIQKLALKIIYPSTEHYVERLKAANITSLCDSLDKICHTYATKVKYDSNHPLHHYIPKKPNNIRTSKRLKSSSVYLPLNRTVKCDKNVLRNPKYLQ